MVGTYMYLYAALVVSIVGPPVSSILAQTQGQGSEDWIAYLLQGGPFAIVLLLIVMDKIGTHGERDRLRAENQELRSEIRTLNEGVRNDIVPPLVEITRLLPEVVGALTRKRAG